MAFGEAQLGHFFEAVVGWVGRLACHGVFASYWFSGPGRLASLRRLFASCSGVVVVGPRGSGVQGCCGAGLVDEISGVTGLSVTAVVACWP